MPACMGILPVQKPSRLCRGIHTMSDRKRTNMILSRTRRNQIYLPYLRKKKYFDAIKAGNAERITALSEENYE